MESKICKGIIYNNKAARLIAVADPVKNSIQMKCKICGSISGYKVSDLKDGAVSVCKECSHGIKIGDTVCNHKVLDYKINNNKICIMCQCIKCGTKKMFSIDDIINKAPKTRCKCLEHVNTKDQISKQDNKKITPAVGIKKINPENQTKNERITSVLNDVAKPKRTKTSNPNIMDHTNTESVTEVSNEEQIKSLQNFRLRSGNLRGDYMELYRYDEYTPKDEKGNTKKSSKIKIMCTKCYTIRDVTQTAWDCNRVTVCNDCKTIGKRAEVKQGYIRSNNWKGFIKNNLEVVSDLHKNSNGVDTVDVVCTTCGYGQDINNKFTIPLMTLIESPNIMCPRCCNAKIKLICPKCNKIHITTSAKAMYDRQYKDIENTQVRCPETDSYVRLPEVIWQHNTILKMNAIKNQFKKNFEFMGVETTLTGDELIRLNSSYVGRDGETYTTYYCHKHGKYVVLKENEVAGYCHDYCMDTRMKEYNKNSKIKE